MNVKIAIMFVVAELLGALICLKTKGTIKRMIMSCIGLGFLFAIVFSDILPDATKNFSYGYLVCILGVLCMCLVGTNRKNIGNYTAVAGMGFHNFCEGIILTSIGSISPILIVGLVLHKLPEGMVTFSLLDGIKDRTRFIIASVIALLIPLGALILIPESIAQPLTAFAAGVIIYASVSSFKKIIVMHYETSESLRTMIAVATFAGAIAGGISCLIV
ncbi:MAG TPA: hypothetical protein VIM42_09510 [Clostridium sp.]